MGKKELLSSTTTIPIQEKWFRFRGMCLGKRYGGADSRIEVMAPTIRQLRGKLAKELADPERSYCGVVEVTFAYVDRVLVHLYEGGPQESGLVRKSVIDGMKFVKETQLSDTYKDIMIQKIRAITQKAKEARNE